MVTIPHLSSLGIVFFGNWNNIYISYQLTILLECSIRSHILQLHCTKCKNKLCKAMLLEDSSSFQIWNCKLWPSASNSESDQKPITTFLLCINHPSFFPLHSQSLNWTLGTGAEKKMRSANTMLTFYRRRTFGFSFLFWVSLRVL